MSELRQNIATREWVIIASERARRPNSFTEKRQTPHTAERPPHDPQCPFCVGNEELDLEIDRHPASGPWQIRIVRNKYPALHEHGPVVRHFDGVQRALSGYGYHEVLIEHPRHNTTLGLMTVDEVRAVLATYLRRGQAISTDPRIEQVVIFKNHGERAGASLQHPHSQIMAVPVVPSDIRHRIEEARRFFDDTGQCVFCAMINDEVARDERIVYANDEFVAFVLYAASSPFHLWILPRRHRACFFRIEEAELDSLASLIREVFYRLYHRLNDPDFNLVLRSAPTKEPENGYFHWYLAVVPRLSYMAGFEMGSGIFINPSIPEACAAFLRE
ncbi:galactose-1-phosphate uridylyltransferase [Chloroflexus sp.]|uniref:galactose-1-phosphate uridylyltransferase n=1 Tax=Chloroflexus sp. TaxID=1904827 RepID=UPI00262627D7|nr:galactose-1-phosphate uridylyltransferase [uncultured Chloroflexus sp.]